MANVPSGANDALPELPALAKSAEEFLAQQYDYVIVGGGTAGLVVAARLSENPDVTVGVLEAGKCKLNDMLVDTPAFFQQMLGNPEYDWMLKTEPQVRESIIYFLHPFGRVHNIQKEKDSQIILGGTEHDSADSDSAFFFLPSHSLALATASTTCHAASCWVVPPASTT